MATKKKAVEKKVSMESLLETGAHFGHMVRRWNPKMEEYIWQAKDGVHIFDLEKTVMAIEAASEFLTKMASQGKRIVIVGTKRQAEETVKEVVAKLPGVGMVTERWLGGTITNWDQMKTRIDRLNKLKSDRESGKLEKYIKKERLLLDREIDKLERFYGGIAGLTAAPEVLIVIDTHKERVAVREANNRGVPVVGIVDSNANPEIITYPIPMNDDAMMAVKLVIEALGLAIDKGLLMIKRENVEVKKEKNVGKN